LWLNRCRRSITATHRGSTVARLWRGCGAAVARLWRGQKPAVILAARVPGAVARQALRVLRVAAAFARGGRINPSSCVEVTTVCSAVPAPSAIRRSLVEKRRLGGRFLDQAPARGSVHCDLATTNPGESRSARHPRAKPAPIGRQTSRRPKAGRQRDGRCELYGDDRRGSSRRTHAVVTPLPARARPAASSRPRLLHCLRAK